ncbi:hypothetical protein H5410_006198 [Solanum commersonii]|uniref:Uncharacterized protein n=1 Tax=Solanum commersonii TaxID=4109 RepID=A0A9J6A9H9_SOLCO|nr:hypothetical protein H5410_006198 [Solanum commersonii]
MAMNENISKRSVRNRTSPNMHNSKSNEHESVSVQIKHLNFGKVVAWTRLALRKSQNDTIWDTVIKQ